MSMSIITGYTGTPHVTSEQGGAENAGMIGIGRYVFDLEQRFAYEIISNNLVRIKNGYGINQGRTFGIVVNDYEDLTIDNGLAGVSRHDLIVARYLKVVETGIESITLEVIKGTSSTSPVDPSYETGNILEGAVEDVFPLYRVVIDELTITSVVQLFTLAPSIEDKYDKSGGEMSGAIVSNLGVSTFRTYTNVLHYSYSSTDNFIQIMVPQRVGTISMKILGIVDEKEFELEINGWLSTAPPDGIYQWHAGTATLNQSFSYYNMVDKVGFYTDSNGFNPSILIYKNAASLPLMSLSIKEVIFKGTPIDNYEDDFSISLRSTTLGLQLHETIDIDSYVLKTNLTRIITSTHSLASSLSAGANTSGLAFTYTIPSGFKIGNITPFCASGNGVPLFASISDSNFSLFLWNRSTTTAIPSGTEITVRISLVAV